MPKSGSSGRFARSARCRAIGVVMALLMFLVSLSAAPAGAAAAALAADGFSRSVSGGWGAADVGGPWTTGGATFSVRDDGGQVTIGQAGHAASSSLTGVSARDVEQLVDFRVDKSPLGWGLLAAVVGRKNSQGAYRVRARLAGDGAVRLSASRVNATGAEAGVGTEVTVPGLTAAAGTRYRLRTQVVGASPTTLRARIWVAGQPEPTAWPFAATDSTSGLQLEGAVGMWTFLSGHQTNTPVTVTYDDFTVVPVAALQTSAPPLATPPSTRPASLSTTAGAAPVGSTSYPVPPDARFVSTVGNNANAGTQAAPWRTLAHAVRAAGAGATIVLRGGTYHDTAILPQGKNLTIQNYPGEAVWLDGAERVTGWVQSGSVWRRDNWRFHPDHTDPTAGHTDPFFRLVSRDFPMAPYPDMVFVNGTQLHQVGSLQQVTTGKFYVDEANHRLYIGTNPTGQRVEAATLTEAIYVDRGHGSVIRGIGIRRYATPLNRYGTVKAFADNVTVENVHILDSATRGLGIEGTGVTVNKTTVTGHGQLGIGGYKSDQLTVRQSIASNNNLERFNNAPVAGGIKVTSSRDLTFRGNAIRDNVGTGLWLDESCYAATIQDNRVQRNTGNGVFFELSSQATVIDNLVTHNAGAGLAVVDSSHLRAWNNTFSTNRRFNVQVLEGPRVATDPTIPGHDPRHPDDPNMTWQVSEISLHNNLLSNGHTDSTSLLGVDDATRTRTAGSMVATNYNGYYRRSSVTPKWASTWANYGGSPSVLVHPTVPAFRDATGQEGNGFGIDDTPDNPFFMDEPAGDYSLRSGSPAEGSGAPLPADIATMIGVPPAPVDMGKLTH